MTFARDQLPDAESYFESEGLRLAGPRNSKWKGTECRFHGGSDSMRIHLATGAWVCMNCGTKGGDVLSYQMQAHGMDFVQACKALGAWIDDGKVPERSKPSPLPPRAALEVLSFEATLVAIAAGNIAKGVAMTRADVDRLLLAAFRITRVSEGY